MEAGIRAVYNAAASQDPHLEVFERMIRENHTDWLPGPHPLMLADLIRIQSNLLEEYNELFKLSEEHYGDAIDISGSCLD